jgi:hypothetical protein
MKITGVAIVRDGITYQLPAPNRHGDVIVEMVKAGVPKPVTKDAIQGFISDTGEFLDRLEAFELVKLNGQNIHELYRPQLYSEDLW